jgi:hypothetical protein
LRIRSQEGLGTIVLVHLPTSTSAVAAGMRLEEVA